MYTYHANHFVQHLDWYMRRVVRRRGVCSVVVKITERRCSRTPTQPSANDLRRKPPLTLRLPTGLASSAPLRHRHKLVPTSSRFPLQYINCPPKMAARIASVPLFAARRATCAAVRRAAPFLQHKAATPARMFSARAARTLF